MERKMIELTEKKDAEPICPHCQQTVQEVWFRELRGILGRRYIYFCASCRKVLGVSHRKGLFMG
jgi:hypothetical protein